MIELFTIAFLGIRFLDVVDILLVAFLLFALYNILKGTVAINIFIGIIAIFLIWKIVDALEMELLSQILGAFISVGFIALIVVFQPEIRKFLLFLGTPKFIQKYRRQFLFWKIHSSELPELNVDGITLACQKMADSKTGALIVIARRNELKQFSETGDILDARISNLLLENIFYKNSPLHDGAVIILENRIKAARCILPVSSNQKLPDNLGLRHRAAVGVSEQSDAIAIVVSEQSGKISLSKAGILIPNIEPSKIKTFLEKEFENDAV